MAGIRPTLPRWRAVGDDGLPLAGAKLLTYQTGTSTPKATYSDSGLTIANANPVVADAGGLFGEIFLDAGDYRFVLTDANDVTIWTSDPVAGASDALLLSGGTMFGPLVLAADPVQPLEAATKRYVDRALLRNTVVSAPVGAVGIASASEISDAFFTYEIIILGIAPSSDNQALLMQWSNDNGATWVTADYMWTQIGQSAASPTPAGTGSASDTAINLCGGMGNGTAENGSFRILFYRPGPGSVGRRHFTWEGSYHNQAPTLVHVRGAAMGTGAGSQAGINALRLLYASGNIAQGRIVLNGIPKL